MKMTFGERLNQMRKNSNLTQDEVASHLGISPQAVSKWENDLSCPDIMLLPEIAKLYGVTVDELLSDNKIRKTDILENTDDAEKNVDKPNYFADLFKHKKKQEGSKKFLKVYVLSQNKDEVNVKLPLSLLKSVKGLLGSIRLNKSMTGGVDLNELDFDEIFDLVDKGVMGEIVNVTTQNGDIVKVYVETE